MDKMEIEIFIPGEFKEEPIICDMIKRFNIVLKIVEASFSTESGWAYLIIDGNKNELDKAFDFLAKKGVKIDFK